MNWGEKHWRSGAPPLDSFTVERRHKKENIKGKIETDERTEKQTDGEKNKRGFTGRKKWDHVGCHKQKGVREKKNRVKAKKEKKRDQNLITQMPLFLFFFPLGFGGTGNSHSLSEEQRVGRIFFTKICGQIRVF